MTHVILNVIIVQIITIYLLHIIAYGWTGSLYPEGQGFRLDFVFGPLDNMIPFVPEMSIFYVFLFFPMMLISTIYFVYIDSEKGFALGCSMLLIELISIVIYIFFPVSTYWWRQELFAIETSYEGNFLAEIIYDVYRFDTSFNCFPSLHAASSTIIAYGWYRYYRIKPKIKSKVMAILTFIIAVGVVLSTLFVKQHYIIDEIAGVSLALVVGKYVLDALWKNFEMQ